MKTFLKADWRKLVLVNYSVKPEVLKPYVPAGTELDIWQNKCYVSLVGFMFLNTKVLGVKIPFHTNFEEVNLRFYVVRKEKDGTIKRGVCFIKEIVSKRAIAAVARVLYNEPYQYQPMQHDWIKHQNNMLIEYSWGKEDVNSIKADIVNSLQPIKEGSEAEFITEHYWGYTATYEGTNEYEVTHPRWMHYPVNNYLVEVDFNTVYGKEWEFLNHLQPNSVLVAEGSGINVKFNKKLI